MRYSEEKLLEELKNFKIVTVKRSNTVDGMKKMTPVLRTFEMLLFSESVNLAQY